MYRRLLVLALAAFAVGTDNFVIAGVLPDMAHDLHVGTETAGQLITAYALAYAVLSPVLAAMTAHWPRRAVLIVGIVVFIAGTAGSALLPWYPAVLAARVVAGAGGGIIVPTSGGVAAIAPPQLRGRALAVVLAGLTAATALGAPIGTAVAAVADWHVTLIAVAVLGVVALGGVVIALPTLPPIPAAGLRARLAPIGDRRVGSVLATTLLAYAGMFLVYAYISVVLDPVTSGDGTTLAVLLLVWGISATVGNLGAGSLVDRYGGYRIAIGAVAIVLVDFTVLHWTSVHLATAIVMLVLWGVAGWGLFVAQQHRAVSAIPEAAPLVIALNSSALYLAVSASSAIGAAVIAAGGTSWLGLVGAVFLLAAFVPALPALQRSPAT
jgi:predicted MFS family arabinose efflux permease